MKGEFIFKVMFIVMFVCNVLMWIPMAEWISDRTKEMFMTITTTANSVEAGCNHEEL